MSRGEAELRAQLEAAMSNSEPFGPRDPKARKQRLPSKLLTEVLLAAPAENAGLLWLRNCRFESDLRFAGCAIRPRMRFHGCSFAGEVGLEQAQITDLSLIACKLDKNLDANHLSVEWDLIVVDCSVKKLLLRCAKIGGGLCLNQSRFKDAGRDGPTIDAGQLKVEGEMACNGATVKGGFSIPGAQIGGPVSMEQITLKAAGKKAKRRENSAFHADTIAIGGFLHADGLAAEGEVRLCGGRIDGQMTMRRAEVTGELALVGTSIGDNALLEGAKLLNEEGIALRADRLRVGSTVMMSGGFRAEGELRIPSVSIGGPLSLRSAVVKGQLLATDAAIEGDLRLDQAELSCEHGVALMGAGLSAKGGLSAHGGFDALGGILLIGAEIGADLMFANATVTQFEGAALRAEGIRVRGSMKWLGSRQITGDMRLTSAHIGESLEIEARLENGQLSLQDAMIGGDVLLYDSKLINEEGPSLEAARVKIGGSFATRQEFESGEMIFVAAQLGAFSIEGATLSPTTRPQRALHCDAIVVEKDFQCENLNAEGEVRMVGARVGGQVLFNGATLGSTGRSLMAERIEVAHGMFFRDGFLATGDLTLSGAIVNNCLDLTGAKLEGASKNALSLRAVKVEQLRLKPARIAGTVDLRRAEVQSLVDVEGEEVVGLPEGAMQMDGFSYRSMEQPLTAKKRKAWLEKSQTERFYPGVYAELAAAFRRIGHASEARKVAIFGELRARDELPKFHPFRAWHIFLHRTVGYGYYNGLALVWLVLLIVIGGVVFGACESEFTKVIEDGPNLEVWLYSIDATVPVLDIGQQHTWAAKDCMAWMATGLSIAGYALVTAVIAGAAGLLGRDQQ